MYTTPVTIMWCGVRNIAARCSTFGIDERLKQLIVEGCQNADAHIEELEVMPDHVHLLVSIDPQFGIHRLVKAFKGRSSRILRQEYPSLCTRMPRRRTNSYFVATIGGAPIEVIKHYIKAAKACLNGKRKHHSRRQRRRRHARNPIPTCAARRINSGSTQQKSRWANSNG